MWSGRESAYANTFGMLMYDDPSNANKIRFDYNNKTVYLFPKPTEGLTMHTAWMGGAQCSLDGTERTITGATVADFNAGAPLTFFAMNTSGTIAYISRVAFAEVKVWSDYENSSSLVRHLLPAAQDGHCGFLDILEGGKFYPNSAASGDDFEVFYPDLTAHSASDLITPAPSATMILLR